MPNQPLTLDFLMEIVVLTGRVAPRLPSYDPKLGLGHGFVGALAIRCTLIIDPQFNTPNQSEQGPCC